MSRFLVLILVCMLTTTKEAKYHYHLTNIISQCCFSILPRKFDRLTRLLHHQKLCSEQDTKFNSILEQLKHKTLTVAARVCFTCKQGFNNVSHLRRHNRTIHGNAYFEEEMRTVSRDVHKGRRKRRVYPCRHCGENCHRKDRLPIHEMKCAKRRKKAQEQASMLKCNVCAKSFTTPARRRRHEAFVHHNLRPYLCHTCGKSFHDATALKDHESRHLGLNRKYGCRFCPMKFYKSNDMNKHERIHTGVKPYKCRQCNKGFARSDARNNHEKTHLKVKLYRCDKCSKSYTSLTYMKIHSRSHTGEKPFSCDYCPKKFISENSLKKHLRLHPNKRKTVECLICGGMYSTRLALGRHMREKHGEDFTGTEDIFTSLKVEPLERMMKMEVANGGDDVGGYRNEFARKVQESFGISTEQGLLRAVGEMMTSGFGNLNRDHSPPLIGDVENIQDFTSAMINGSTPLAVADGSTTNISKDQCQERICSTESDIKAAAETNTASGVPEEKVADVVVEEILADAPKSVESVTVSDNGTEDSLMNTADDEMSEVELDKAVQIGAGCYDDESVDESSTDGESVCGESSDGAYDADSQSQATTSCTDDSSEDEQDRDSALAMSETESNNARMDRLRKEGDLLHFRDVDDGMRRRDVASMVSYDNFDVPTEVLIDYSNQESPAFEEQQQEQCQGECEEECQDEECQACAEENECLACCNETKPVIKSKVVMKYIKSIAKGLSASDPKLRNDLQLSTDDESLVDSEREVVEEDSDSDSDSESEDDDDELEQRVHGGIDAAGILITAKMEVDEAECEKCCVEENKSEFHDNGELVDNGGVDESLDGGGNVSGARLNDVGAEDGECRKSDDDDDLEETKKTQEDDCDGDEVNEGCEERCEKWLETCAAGEVESVTAQDGEEEEIGDSREDALVESGDKCLGEIGDDDANVVEHGEIQVDGGVGCKDSGETVDGHQASEMMKKDEEIMENSREATSDEANNGCVDPPADVHEDEAKEQKDVEAADDHLDNQKDEEDQAEMSGNPADVVSEENGDKLGHAPQAGADDNDEGNDVVDDNAPVGRTDLSVSDTHPAVSQKRLVEQAFLNCDMSDLESPQKQDLSYYNMYDDNQNGLYQSSSFPMYNSGGGGNGDMSSQEQSVSERQSFFEHFANDLRMLIESDSEEERDREECMLPDAVNSLITAESESVSSSIPDSMEDSSAGQSKESGVLLLCPRCGMEYRNIKTHEEVDGCKGVDSVSSGHLFDYNFGETARRESQVNSRQAGSKDMKGTDHDLSTIDISKNAALPSTEDVPISRNHPADDRVDSRFAVDKESTLPVPVNKASVTSPGGLSKKKLLCRYCHIDVQKKSRMEGHEIKCLEMKRHFEYLDKNPDVVRKMVSDMKNYSCRICFKNCLSRTRHETHIRICQTRKFRLQQVKKGMEPTGDFSCSYCCRLFEQQQDREEHERECGRLEKQYEQLMQSPLMDQFVCRHCDKVFERKFKWRRHEPLCAQKGKGPKKGSRKRKQQSTHPNPYGEPTVGPSSMTSLKMFQTLQDKSSVPRQNLPAKSSIPQNSPDKHSTMCDTCRTLVDPAELQSHQVKCQAQLDLMNNCRPLKRLSMDLEFEFSRPDLDAKRPSLRDRSSQPKLSTSESDDASSTPSTSAPSTPSRVKQKSRVNGLSPQRKNHKVNGLTPNGTPQRKNNQDDATTPQRKEAKQNQKHKGVGLKEPKRGPTKPSTPVRTQTQKDSSKPSTPDAAGLQQGTSSSKPPVSPVKKLAGSPSKMSALQIKHLQLKKKSIQLQQQMQSTGNKRPVYRCRYCNDKYRNMEKLMVHERKCLFLLDYSEVPKQLLSNFGLG